MRNNDFWDSDDWYTMLQRTSEDRYVSQAPSVEEDAPTPQELQQKASSTYSTD